MIEDAPFRRCSKTKILRVSRVEIKEGRQLHGLGVRHAVTVNRSGGKDAQLRHVGVTRVFIFQEFAPGVLGECEQGRVAGARVGPQHAFHIGDVSHRLSVVRTVIEEVLAQSCGNICAIRIAGQCRCIGEGREAAEQHILRPAMKIANRIFKELGAEIAIVVGMRERVVERSAHLRHQFLVLEHKGQSRCAVEPIGLLLPWPPGIGCLLSRPIGIAERPGNLRQLRAELCGLFFENSAQPALGPHGSGPEWLQRAVVRDAGMCLLGREREPSLRQRSGSQQSKAQKFAAVPCSCAKVRRVLHSVLFCGMLSQTLACPGNATANSSTGIAGGIPRPSHRMR